jgi:hypothetical protein
MTRLVTKAENWQKVYQAYSSINFTAFDYNSVKKSLIDYLKIYHAESFGDYIESSELITIVEAFAYVAELFAYRLDQNANENLITTAQRRESVLRLAKLLSYNVSRNIPARGLVKVGSISSTERVFDSRGNDLSNKIITWNDPNNPNWKEQFLLVINKVLSQDFGSVLPSDRVQVEDVLLELYAFNNNPLQNNVLSYQVTVANQSFPMEIVSCQLNQYGPYEMRPQKGMELTVLYLSDGLGDSSDNTGFFFFTKQGTLQRLQTNFDGVTPNQTFDVPIQNVNQTDVWLNNINPDTGLLITSSDLLNQNNAGQWVEVDITNAQNIVFNTNPIRNKYEIETLDKDQVRFIFGDGNFANVPNGTFEIWIRSSANLDYIIPTNSLQNVGSNFNYYDTQGKEQTFAFTFSLLDPIQNAAPSEDIEHIRNTAPAVYYTQDRMVNGRDYNEFMLKDNSILKLQAINRTFSGDSKYIFWHDASNYYENVKIFGDDLVVYFTTDILNQHVPGAALPAPDGGSNINLVDALTYNYIQPILTTNEFYVNAILNGAVLGRIEKTFSPSEVGILQNNLNNLIYNVPETLYLTYDGQSNSFSFTETEPLVWNISITSNVDNSWDINYYSKKLILHSDQTKFWVNNNGQKIITLDTFNTNLDQVIILSANVGANGSVLGLNHPLNIVQQMLVDVGSEQGTYSIHDLLAIPGDNNGDGIPDDITLNYLINSVSTPTTGISYVYFNRSCSTGTCPWVFQPGTPENIQAYKLDLETNPIDKRLWKKEIGVERVNFLWLHATPRYHLVDPSPTNIIDMFIVPRGYYTAYKQWLAGDLASPPALPTTFELRASYNYLLDNKMISDSLILHPGKIKLLFGDNADTSVQGKFVVVKSPNSVMTDNQIKTTIVNAIQDFFDINLWEFGETFYFTELAAYVHTRLPADISSIVLVPLYEQNIFGDLFQIFTEEDEILQAQVEVSNIQIVQSLDPLTIKQYS